MKPWQVCGILLACLSLGESYSKYGRSCKDIGCRSNEVCVMENDPCSYYQRQDECGSYPTCKKVDSGPRTCTNYVCPPTKVCKMDGNTPKCVDDHSHSTRVGYDTSEIRNPNDQPGGGSLYPNLARGETTPRPNIGYQGASGQGYQGGQVGSGYPGQPRPNYPQQGTYPQQPPYQRSGSYPGYNPQGGYPGYPQQGQGGYPQQGQRGYPQQGQGGYPQQGGYPSYNNQRYPQGSYNPYGQQNRYSQNSASGGFVDSLTGALKKYGTNVLKNAITQQILGTNRN